LSSNLTQYIFTDHANKSQSINTPESDYEDGEIALINDHNDLLINQDEDNESAAGFNHTVSGRTSQSISVIPEDTIDQRTANEPDTEIITEARKLAVDHSFKHPDPEYDGTWSTEHNLHWYGNEYTDHRGNWSHYRLLCEEANQWRAGQPIPIVQAIRKLAQGEARYPTPNSLTKENHLWRTFTGCEYPELAALDNTTGIYRSNSPDTWSMVSLIYRGTEHSNNKTNESSSKTVSKSPRDVPNDNADTRMYEKPRTPGHDIYAINETSQNDTRRPIPTSRKDQPRENAEVEDTNTTRRTTVKKSNSDCKRCLENTKINKSAHDRVLIKMRYRENKHTYEPSCIDYTTNYVMHTKKYWTKVDFYEDIYKRCEHEAEDRFPFTKFKDVGIEYTFKRAHIRYRAHTGEEVMITKKATHKKVGKLPEPKHIKKDLSKNRGYDYDGMFEVTFFVTIDTEVAITKNLTYRDDLLAQRIKKIVSQKRDYQNLDAMAKIMLAVSDYTRSGWTKEGKFTKFPYPQLDDPFEKLLTNPKEDQVKGPDELGLRHLMTNPPRRALLGKPPGLPTREDPDYVNKPFFNDYATAGLINPAYRAYTRMTSPPPWRSTITSRHEEELKTKKMRENINPPRTHRSYHC